MLQLYGTKKTNISTNKSYYEEFKVLNNLLTTLRNKKQNTITKFYLYLNKFTVLKREEYINLNMLNKSDERRKGNI